MLVRHKSSKGIEETAIETVAKSPDRLTTLLAHGVFAIFVAASYFRIYYTVDFTDEALYSAIPYRFALGDTPFGDEWNLTQTASLLAFPFIKAFLSITGASEAIILYARHLVFLFSIAVGCAVFYSLKRKFPWQWALLLSLLPVVFVPYNLLGPGYNALGGGFFTLGLFLGWDAKRHARHGAWTLAAGVAHGLAALAYPTLVVAALCFLFFLLWTSNEKRKTFLLYATGGIVAPFLILAAFRVRPESVVLTLQYLSAAGEKTGHGWNLQKVAILAKDAWSQCFYKPLLAALLVSIWMTRDKRFAFFLALFWPVALFFSNRAAIGGMGVQGFLLYNALAAPFFYVLVPRNRLHRFLLLGLWLPASVAGATMAWSSNMGILAAANGMVTANIVSLLFLCICIQERSPRRSLLALAPICMVLAVILYSRNNTYMDDGLRLLTKRVQSGPFRGLYTTPEKKAYLEQISKDLMTAKGSARNILFLPHFPAGYLLTSLHPAAQSVWASCMLERAFSCFDYYRSKIHGSSSIVVRIKDLYYHSQRTDSFPALDQDPIENLLKTTHRLVISRSAYDIYEYNGT